MFKVIVAGSRGFGDYSKLCSSLDRLLVNVSPAEIEIVSGCARGADSLAILYAKDRGYACTKMPADWSSGRGAGYRRNEAMGRYADVLVAFWDGQSRGTKHMIGFMRQLGKPYRIVRF